MYMYVWCLLNIGVRCHVEGVGVGVGVGAGIGEESLSMPAGPRDVRDRVDSHKIHTR